MLQRHLLEQDFKRRVGQQNQMGFSHRLDAGGTRELFQDAHLAEEIPLLQPGHFDVSVPALHQDAHLTPDDDEELGSQIALMENYVSGAHPGFRPQRGQQPESLIADSD